MYRPPRTANGVSDDLGRVLPAGAVREVFEEFGRRGLMFLDEDLAVALPAVSGR